MNEIELAEEKFDSKLAQALKDEFPFVMGIGIQADDPSWLKAATGIRKKMASHGEPRSEFVDSRFYVEGVD